MAQSNPSRSPEGLEESIEGDSLSDQMDEEEIRRKNVRTACLECKRRKLRCTGIFPCERCDKAGIVCHFDEEGDQRRKQVLKRKIESVEDKGELLDRLVATLQETEKSSAMQLINMIRSDVPLEDIRAFIDDLLQRPKLEKTPELIDVCSGVREWHESQKRAENPHLIDAEIPSMTLFEVPARPWTTVTQNDKFVSHLVSLWFTWEHPFLNWIDRDRFIREMKSGDLDSQFCSPFLVNIILASACVYSIHREAYSVASEDESRGLHFYQEAKRLLDTDDVEISVPHVQGLGVMYVFTCMIGKDRAGWMYMGQLAYATQELAKKHSKSPPRESDPESLRDAQATEHALWGVFNLAAMTSLSYQKGSMINAPRASSHASDSDSDSDDEEWSDYPIQSQRIKSHSQVLFNKFCQVSRITYDLSWSLFGNGEKKPILNTDFVKVIDDAYSRLKACREGFPACLGINNDPAHVLSFHMKYHTIIQTIFGVLKDLPKDEQSNIDADWEKKCRENATNLCVESAREVARLIDAHGDSWSHRRMAPVNIHWVTVSMFTLLPYLEDTRNQKPLDRLVAAARAFSRIWPLGKGMLRLLQVTAKQTGVKLPDGTQYILDEFEQKEWSEDDRKGLNSQYPNFSSSMKGGEVDEVEMDKFLAKFDELYTEEHDEDDFSTIPPMSEDSETRRSSSSPSPSPGPRAKRIEDEEESADD